MNHLSIREQAVAELSSLAPKNHVKGFLHTKEAARNTPREFECETHGVFKTKFSEIGSGKIMINATCSKCIDEHEDLINKKESELMRKQNDAKKQKEAEERAGKLKSRGVGKRYLDNSFENFKVDTPGKKNALLRARDVCERITSKDNPTNLIMVGGVGTGKTHLANSMIIYLTDNGYSCGRINLIDMVRALKATWNKDSELTEACVLATYSECDLLIVDEVGVQFNSDTEKMFIFDVINSRYEEELPTVIISNLDVSGVKEIIGERCVDRLREDGGKVVAFDWGSYR